MSSTSFLFVAFMPFESWDDCQAFARQHKLHDFAEQCVGVDAQGHRTDYTQEQSLAPRWTIRPKARPADAPR